MSTKIDPVVHHYVKEITKQVMKQDIPRIEIMNHKVESSLNLFLQLQITHSFSLFFGTKLEQIQKIEKKRRLHIDQLTNNNIFTLIKIKT